MVFETMKETLVTHNFLGMPAVVRSDAMERVLDIVRRVAPVNAAILVTGESGVGKELVARAIHQYSPRGDDPWVDVSCATLPEHLVESELFGHEKGAFSSADSAKPGLFELADTGTLFLDEVGELPPRMQVKLLRVLDGVSYYRVGGTKKVNVDVRLVAATNLDLGDLVRTGKFRADLYHRLSQINVTVPPLRQRQTDILPLAAYFLSESGTGAELEAGAEAALLNYQWPGNIRELRNALVKASVLCVDGSISPHDLPKPDFSDSGQTADLTALATALNSKAARPSVSSGNGDSEDWSLESMERRMIQQVLERTAGHQQKAADMLGISRRTLSRKLSAYTPEGAG
jgi:two-component system, NtrC family, response regulator AtoC